MKNCGLKNPKIPRILLAVGIMMLAVGNLMHHSLGTDDGSLARLAGFIIGASCSITIVAAIMIIRRKLMSPEKSAQIEVDATDERNQLLNLKACSVGFFTCLGANFVLCLIMSALDQKLGAILLIGAQLVVAITVYIARRWYDHII